ncbi:MAG: ribonuclease J [Clostridiales bacterium]|nr:MAG: ribonuclease J [Clostridiales bacterium]
MSRNKKEGTVSVIPLGGLGEIGKNMTVVKFDDEILVIDAGLMFPEEELLGIDVVIPDISYLLENRQLVRGIVLTHGHEDHIGALPYVLRELNVPVYGTALTIGLLEAKLKEAGIKDAKLHVQKQGTQFRVGKFRVELLRTCHSIPDACAIAIHTPYGVIFHTGDFKFDQTPVDGKLTDFQRIAELGYKGVLLMMSDSTNAERPGYSLSEKMVGKSFDDIFRGIEGRIIVATFASNVHRVQQVIDAAYNYKRKVAVAGRSLVNTVSVAQELGYLHVPKNLLIELEDINKYPANKVVIITTGSQGEPMSGLSRMAMSDHRKVQIIKGDTIILSANPIPGNEKLINRVSDLLFKQGADVIQGSEAKVHVSGHAYREDLKLMLNLVQPKYFMPVHGEYSKLLKHALLAEEVGMSSENVFVSENGNVLEVNEDKAAITGKVTSGRVLIDGLGVGDVGNIVLGDRKQLSQDGIVIVVVTIDKENKQVVAGPDLVSRGFVYVREADELMDEAKERVNQCLAKCMEKNITEWAGLKSGIRETLSKYLYEKTRRRPMILPIIMEV